MTEAWWDGFFDDAYTDAWEAAGAFAETAQEVVGLRSVLPASSGLRILDLPCGFGRHSGPLAADGHEVTGMDRSPDQLRLAAERNPGPTYLEGDMRHPPPGPFDVVLNLYSSFGYFADAAEDRAALTAWHGVLAPGGLLVLTGNHRDRVARLHQPGEAVRYGDSGVVERPSIDWVSGVAHNVVELPDGSTRRFRVRLYSATQLVALVTAVGFVDIEVFGDFDRSPLTPDTRLLLLARRAA